MKRSNARGRVYPQSFSTDRRFGRLSLKAVALYPFIWANADDQGRINGDPEELKYEVCANIDHITKSDMPGLLAELHEHNIIYWYDTPKGKAIQCVDWWNVNNKLQWAYPSALPTCNGWKDHLRYKQGLKEVLTLNWPPLEEDSSGDTPADIQVNTNIGSGEITGEANAKPPFKSPSSPTPLSPPYNPPGKPENEKEEGKEPEESGEPAPSSDVCTGREGDDDGVIKNREEARLFENLLEHFRIDWGMVKPGKLKETIPKEPDFRETAQLRDLAAELYAAGADADSMIIKEAFRDAGLHNKFHISYVRTILLSWLGSKKTYKVRPP